MYSSTFFAAGCASCHAAPGAKGEAKLRLAGGLGLKTPFGTFDCWLYTANDPEAGTVSRYYFAKELPGAPVHVHVEKAGATLTEMTQVARQPAPGGP